MIKKDRKKESNRVARWVLASNFLIIILIGCGVEKPRTTPDQEKDPQYHYEKAVVAMKYQLPDVALDFLQQALALDPNHYPSYNLLGLIFHQKKDYPRAVEALRKAVELKPEAGEAYHNLGVVYQDMGSTESAEQAYRRAAELGYERSYFWLARVLLDQKKYDEAISFGLKAAGSNPKDSSVYNLLGVAWNEKKEYRRAVACFEQALLLAPEDPITLINLGIAYLNSGEKEKARQNLEKALPLLQDQSLIEKVKIWLKEIK